MKVGDICNGVAVLVPSQASIQEAARRMREQHVGALVVVDSEQEGPVIPRAIVTDRDIVVGVVAQDPDRIHKLKVKDIIVSDLYTAGEDESVWDVLEAMRDRGVRRAPVVDASGTLVGILSYSDILSVLTEQLSDLVKLTVQERLMERATRTT